MIALQNLIKRYKKKYSQILTETDDYIELIYLCDSLNLDIKKALENALIWSDRIKYSKKLTPTIISNWQENRIIRIDRYKSENKNPSIIDLSLYEIYAESKELANLYYKELVAQKTKKMINSDSTNRICWTKEFLIEKHGEEVGLLKYNNHLDFLKNISRTSVSHFINLGYSELDAKIELSKRQSAFSLAKCIKKFGEIGGKTVWQARQDKWQETLNNKSPEDIEELNKKKSNKNKFKVSNDYKFASIYVIKLNENLYKFGISEKKIKGQRYNKSTMHNKPILLELSGYHLKIKIIESLIKVKFNEFIIKKSEEITPFGYTETLNLKTPKELLNTIKVYHSMDFKLLFSLIDSK